MQVRPLLPLVALVLASESAAAQTMLEVEPNESKALADANPPVFAWSGVSISGTSLGSSTTPGSGSVDTWRIRQMYQKGIDCGLCKHTLTFDPTGHVVTIRGLDQVGGIVQPGTDREVQSSITLPDGSRAVSWYAFEGDLYVTVAGTAETVQPYRGTLTSQLVPIELVPKYFVDGPIVITTMGLTDADTELDLYVLSPFGGAVHVAHNDDQTLDGTTTQSRIARVLAPGEYWLVVGPSKSCTSQSDAAPDENDLDDPVLDFPGPFVTSEAQVSSLDLDFAVTDALGTVTVANPGAVLFGLKFWRFHVVSTAELATAYCSGDGSGTACPCGNAGAAGRGCASSVNPSGASLDTEGQHGLTMDSLVLVGSGMPNSTTVFFQGSAHTAGGSGTVFGDGLRCVSGIVRRLDTKLVAGGAARYPDVGDPPVSIQGQVSAGTTGHYQCWYRNAAAFCTPAGFNMTNGARLTWFP